MSSISDLHKRTTSSLVQQQSQSSRLKNQSSSSALRNQISSTTRVTVEQPRKDKNSDAFRTWTFPKSPVLGTDNSPFGSPIPSNDQPDDALALAGAGAGGPGVRRSSNHTAQTPDLALGSHSPTRASSSTTTANQQQQQQHATTGLAINGVTVSGRLGAIAESSMNDSNSTPPRRSRSPSPSPGHFSFNDSPSPQPRHKPNTSIAYSSHLSSHHYYYSLNPRDLAKLAYANLRRTAPKDALYALVFLGSVLVFFSALLGAGYDESLSSSMGPAGGGASPAVGSKWDASSTMMRTGASRWIVLKDHSGDRLEKVNLPKVFTGEDQEEGDVPIDVHQPHGDSSHDTGEEWVRDSPEELDANGERRKRLTDRRVRPAHNVPLAHRHAPPSSPPSNEDDSLPGGSNPHHSHSDSSGNDDDVDDDDVDDNDEGDFLPLSESQREAEAEDSFRAHPLHIVDEEDEGELVPDFLHPDGNGLKRRTEERLVVQQEEEEEEDTRRTQGRGRQQPEKVDISPVEGEGVVVVDVTVESEDDDDGKPPQEIGDSFRRPAGREGIEEMKRLRERMGRERDEMMAQQEEGVAGMEDGEVTEEGLGLGLEGNQQQVAGEMDAEAENDEI
ncbi:hypothetical protein T439DRAFT_383355 [Meredithblackwellia eburnea MCA 4105]